MNNQRPKNLDGFVLRRRVVNQETPGRLGVDNLAVPDRFKSPVEIENRRNKEMAPRLGATATDGANGGGGLKRSELDASLASIDDAPKNEPPKNRRKLRLNRKFFKRLLIILGILILLVGGYFGVKIFLAGGRVFDGNLFDLFGSGKELKMDQNGRSNILVFGTSEDSIAHQEEGAGTELTDSVLVISVDQNNKNAVMFSVPRDLWVKYGEACNAGFEGRINEVYGCGREGATEQQGAQKLMGVVEENFGIEMHYYAKVSFTVLKDAVNAVGGITVEIDSDDPRGVYDPNFDWQCNFECELVRWPNGPANLDGEQALALARARNASGGYGLGGGNFDREQYQQKIIVALQQKTANAGTLANPVAVSGLIDTLGNNVSTSFDTGEVKTLVGLANDIKQDSIKRLSLVNEEDPILTTGNVGGASIVRPVAGLYDFSDVQSYLRRQLSNNITAQEDASIEVLNGTDTAGVAGKKAEQLSTQGVIVSSTGDAPTSDSYGDLQWFDLSGGTKPQTATKLQQVLGEPSSGSVLPRDVYSDADFVIIVGNGVN